MLLRGSLWCETYFKMFVYPILFGFIVLLLPPPPPPPPNLAIFIYIYPYLVSYLPLFGYIRPLLP